MDAQLNISFMLPTAYWFLFSYSLTSSATTAAHHQGISEDANPLLLNCRSHDTLAGECAISNSK